MRNYRPYLTQAARDLRRQMTPAEKILWEELRHHRQLGHHFRRQVPVGPFIADFACLSKKLIVEVDGRHHLDNPQDAERDRWLRANRFRVLRFQNDEILGNMPSVRDAITRALLNLE
jgi:very-short-patch-repair endonuclease